MKPEEKRAEWFARILSNEGQGGQCKSQTEIINMRKLKVEATIVIGELRKMPQLS